MFLCSKTAQCVGGSEHRQVHCLHGIYVALRKVRARAEMTLAGKHLSLEM